jgi:hypothetical protein
MESGKLETIVYYNSSNQSDLFEFIKLEILNSGYDQYPDDGDNHTGGDGDYTSPVDWFASEILNLTDYQLTEDDRNFIDSNLSSLNKDNSLSENLLLLKGLSGASTGLYTALDQAIAVLSQTLLGSGLPLDIPEDTSTLAVYIYKNGLIERSTPDLNLYFVDAGSLQNNTLTVETLDLTNAPYLTMGAGVDLSDSAVTDTVGVYIQFYQENVSTITDNLSTMPSFNYGTMLGESGGAYSDPDYEKNFGYGVELEISNIDGSDYLIGEIDYDEGDENQLLNDWIANKKLCWTFESSTEVCVTDADKLSSYSWNREFKIATLSATYGKGFTLNDKMQGSTETITLPAQQDYDDASTFINNMGVKLNSLEWDTSDQRQVIVNFSGTGFDDERLDYYRLEVVLRNDSGSVVKNLSLYSDDYDISSLDYSQTDTSISFKFDLVELHEENGGSWNTPAGYYSLDVFNLRLKTAVGGVVSYKEFKDFSDWTPSSFNKPLNDTLMGIFNGTPE